MAVQVNYLDNTTYTGLNKLVFLSKQSGCARPYWEVIMTISGEAVTNTAILGRAYQADNDIIGLGSIDREKPIALSGIARLVAGDVTITLDNTDDKFTPRATGSIFCDAAGSSLDYMHSTINIWAGFEQQSGTALVIKRGSFLMTELRIDSEKKEAYIRGEDVAKIPLSQYLGLTSVSGTANTWIPPGGVASTKAIMTEMLSAIGLTAGQYELATGIDFNNFSITSGKVSDYLAWLAQASDGFMYTKGNGTIVFQSNTPLIDPTGLASFDLDSKTNIRHLKYEIKMKDLINRVLIQYGSNIRGAEDLNVAKGHTQVLTNNIIDRDSIANSLASRYLTLYSNYKPFAEIDCTWLPSVELGDYVYVTDTGTHQTSVTYEIFRIVDDIDSLTTKIYGVDITQNEPWGTNKQKWGFVSSSDVAACGTLFTDYWHSGFAFASYELGNPPLQNGTFELWSGGTFTSTYTAPSNWVLAGTGNFVKEKVEIFAGSCSMYIENTNIDSSYMRVYSANYNNTEQSGTWLASVMNRKVVAKCRAKSSTANSIYVRIGTNVEFTASVAHAGDGNWAELSVTAVVTAGNNLFLIDAYISGTAFNAYFDNMDVTSYPYFDLDGDGDMTIDTGLALSGAGTTGIELPFVAY